MEMVLNNGFREMKQDEVELIEGGAWYNSVLQFAGGITVEVGTCCPLWVVVLQLLQ